jgi:hypothetical protein
MLVLVSEARPELLAPAWLVEEDAQPATKSATTLATTTITNLLFLMMLLLRGKA